MVRAEVLAHLLQDPMGPMSKTRVGCKLLCPVPQEQPLQAGVPLAQDFRWECSGEDRLAGWAPFLFLIFHTFTPQLGGAREYK